ncbi:hypothetical protein BOSEA31B_10294 [Hyphomicrobiales bacterium]|nr:hypothetical protein BOSEA31B_10294 [Hyphomicrobiales bacterium]CAH1701974.1 hypothetical protein BOSEA1005_21673 [Hyphomicrobiales bacterium]CAI0346132.1 hypothetical protein BO1005MUT1_470290 [Hyphomicrobiales bacterium]
MRRCHAPRCRRLPGLPRRQRLPAWRERPEPRPSIRFRNSSDPPLCDQLCLHGSYMNYNRVSAGLKPEEGLLRIGAARGSRHATGRRNAGHAKDGGRRHCHEPCGAGRRQL